MNFRIALLLPLALLVVSCSRGTSVGFFSGRSASVSGSEAGSNGYCQPRKHSCEHYEKEKRKKNPQSAKIDRYRSECGEYNRSCR
jgi:hypothetical protein